MLFNKLLNSCGIGIKNLTSVENAHRIIPQTQSNLLARICAVVQVCCD